MAIAACGKDVAGGTAVAPNFAAPTFQVPARFEDAALHGLAVGLTSPPLEDLDDRALATLTRLLGGVMATYEQADFELFAAMRGRDLERTPPAAYMDRLADLVTEVGGTPSSREWPALLAEYWRAYYRVPPVRRFDPASTIATLRSARQAGVDRAAWDAELVPDASQRSFIRHALVAPHARDVLTDVADLGVISWIDFALGFETPDGELGHVWLRFVWDELDCTWFLERAFSTIDSGLAPDVNVRNLVL